MLKLNYFLFGLGLMTSAAFADFSLKSSAFHNNERIPVLYTCNGDNISPPLSWEEAPAGTQSFVLILSSPGWINEEIYLWILYNLPAKLKSLTQGIKILPSGTQVGTNYYEETQYRGPCPPDKRVHPYVFTLYALDKPLAPIDDELEAPALLDRIKPHILKKTTLTGVFSH
jgi:Raf kinase inhibitor-like YbhB/YbcL family protein